ncbi:MAG: hypothetical protein IPG70_07015 [Moraxellaceae bacterium]|nr:hypothetical protein [Moraxellaceae bacterium]
MSPQIRYLAKKTWDEVLILGAFAKVSFDNATYFDEDEQAVLAALRRTTPDLSHASPQEIGDYLRPMDEDSILGVVNNTKGVLHEMEFVALENEDGDSVYASLFDDPHHPYFDIQLTDSHTGVYMTYSLKPPMTQAILTNGLMNTLMARLLLIAKWPKKWGCLAAG